MSDWFQSHYWSAKLTVDELARQHFNLARSFAAIPELFCRHCWVFPVLFVDVFGVVSPLRPELDFILLLALDRSAPGEK
jgi:hypothetical protein